MKTIIGQTAGKVWKKLKEKDQVNIEQLPRLLKEKSVIAYQAVGWLAREGKINYLPVTYFPSPLKGAFLIIAATNDRTINSCVAKDASKLGILVNVVDCPAKSSFILPATLSRGDLTIAVSTAGRSPALARKIKDDLALIYSDEYGDLLDMIAKARAKIRRKYPGSQRRKQIWTEFMEKIWP